MKETNNFRDLHSQNESPKYVEEKNKQLIGTAWAQLEQVASSLKDLAQRIIDEKPDMVVFLDKGARVMATPIEKFIRDKTEHLPEMRFYNDDRLKGSYLHFQDGNVVKHNFLKVVEEDFVPHKGKKVFFIDETFSGGKGAAALSEAIEVSGVDGYYFALTKDPEPLDEQFWDDEPDHRVSYQQVQDAVERLRQSGRLRVYDNNIGYLFTKDAATLYVVDKEQGQTSSRYELIPRDEVGEEYDYSLKPNKLPDGRAYMSQYEDRDWKEHDKEIRLSNRRTLDELKKLIFEALKKNN